NKVALRAHLSLHDDETSALCHWQIPAAHFLESWSDARGYDGTASIVQPLIAPLYGGKTAHEVVAATSDRPERSAYDLVRDYWRRQDVAPRAPSRPAGSQPAGTPDPFESAWRRWLHDGVIPGTAFTPQNVSLTSDASRANSTPAAAATG